MGNRDSMQYHWNRFGGLFFLTTDLFTPNIDKALDELAHHVASFPPSKTCLKGLCLTFNCCIGLDATFRQQ